jgi:hypothetical protein
MAVFALLVLAGAAVFALRAVRSPGPEVSYDTAHTGPLLTELRRIGDLHLCRFVVSDRTVYHLREDGSIGYLTGDGGTVDYVSVGTVDALVPLSGVTLRSDEVSGALVVEVPEIRVAPGVTDENASFVWRADADVELGTLASMGQGRAALRARQLGIEDCARESAARFFEGFFGALGRGRVEVRFGPLYD